MTLPSRRRVVLRGGPLDGVSRSVLTDGRRAWFKEPLSDRRHEYRQDPGDAATWRHVREEGGGKA